MIEKEMSRRSLFKSSLVGATAVGAAGFGLASTAEAAPKKAKAVSIYEFEGLARKQVTESTAGNIIAMSGIGDITIGDTICAPDCVEMEGAAVSQIAAKNDVPCVILRAMSDNADEDGHEVLVVKKFSIAEYVATATRIVAAMVEAL